MKRGACRQNSEETNTSEAWFKNPILDLQNPCLPWIVERGWERAPESMETKSPISGGGMTPQVSHKHCQAGRPGCSHVPNDFMLSYEAIWVGACQLFRDDALGLGDESGKLLRLRRG